MSKYNERFLGVAYAVVGIFLFSAKAVLVKLAYKAEATSMHLLLFRMSFALPFYIIITLFITPKKKNGLTKKHYAWLLFFGLWGYYIASFLDFMGLQYIKAGLERIILFVYPTMVLILSSIFLKKNISKNQLWAIIITYIGVFITFWGELDLQSDSLYLGAGLIFLSALTYAAYLVGSDWLIPSFGVMRFTSYAMIIACLAVISHYLLTDRSDFMIYGNEVYFYGFLMAMFCTIIPSYLVSASIKKLGASTFAVFGSLGPFSTILLAYFFLAETLSWVQVIGAVIVITGVYIANKK
ncbi:MAG: DMT family transporter [Cyclobacteriaceae bacterium]